MNKEIVIIGGGIAGLSAANYLADKNIATVLVEAGEYPSHKICGEFISPECLPILESWGVLPTSQIQQIQIISGIRQASFNLNIPARSMSRYVLDQQLAQRASIKGVEIKTNTKVISIQRIGDCYELNLSQGETIVANKIITGTGRLDKFSAVGQEQAKYVGLKAHIQNFNIGPNLIMHILPKGGYLGMVPISSSEINIAALLPIFLFEGVLPQDYYERFLNLCPSDVEKTLRKNKLLVNLQTVAPKFGVKSIPDWNDVYFIGDAAGTIPPASGSGLNIAISSGCMAAEYAIKNQAPLFRKAWKKRYTQQFQAAQILHELMMRPKLAHFVMGVSEYLPTVPLYLFQMTRTRID